MSVISRWRLPAALLLAFSLAPLGRGGEASRVAILPFEGDERGEVAAELRRLASAEAELLDPDLVRMAVAGSGYAGSLNLGLPEARALGQSLGCDFYLLGRVLETRRQLIGGKERYDGVAGIYLVESHSGRLARFEYLRTEGREMAEVHAALLTRLPVVWGAFAAIIGQSQRRDRSLDAAVITSGSGGPISEVMTDEELSAGPDGELPLFLRRVKPVYTEEAASAEVVGTVDLLAVFGADGQVGEVEVTRWAGFGLDEAAVAAIRQARFRPALRAKIAVPIRGLVRYTFRRPPPAGMAENPPGRAKDGITSGAHPGTEPGKGSKEIENLKNSLRDLLRPKVVPR